MVIFFFQEAKTLIERAESDERKLYIENMVQIPEPKKVRVPPAPLLLCKTDTSMVFKPAPFIPAAGGQKVKDRASNLVRTSYSECIKIKNIFTS